MPRVAFSMRGKGTHGRAARTVARRAQRANPATRAEIARLVPLRFGSILVLAPTKVRPEASTPADRNSKRMTSAEAVVVDREVEVRRGSPCRQVAPRGLRSQWNACLRAVRRALGPWSGRLGNERAYSLARGRGRGACSAT